jgi:ESCRT-II complex subunit
VENRCQPGNSRKGPDFLQQGHSTYVTGTPALTTGKLKLEFLRELVDSMVKDGQAEWVDKNTKVQALLYWLKPEEWANIISNWVCGVDSLLSADRRDWTTECRLDVV